jgi:hypothetical protein
MVAAKAMIISVSPRDLPICIRSTKKLTTGSTATNGCSNFLHERPASFAPIELRPQLDHMCEVENAGPAGAFWERSRRTCSTMAGTAACAAGLTPDLSPTAFQVRQPQGNQNPGPYFNHGLYGVQVDFEEWPTCLACAATKLRGLVQCRPLHLVRCGTTNK